MRLRRAMRGLCLAFLSIGVIGAAIGSPIRLIGAAPAEATVAGSTYAETVMADSPKMYWRMGSSGYESDEEVNTSTHLPRWGVNGYSVPGAGGALLGDSDTAYSMAHSVSGTDVPGPPEEMHVKERTLEGWVKVNNLSDGGGFAIAGTCGSVLRATVLPDGRVAAEGYYPAMSTQSATATSAATVDDSEWHYIVAVGKDKTLDLYIDGVIEARVPTDGGLFDYCRLESHQWAAYASFTADFDEMASYWRALKPGEIQDHYRASGRQPAKSLSEMFGPNGALRNQAYCAVCAGDPVDLSTGDLFMPVPSVSVAGRGPGLNVDIAYNSMASERKGAFGYGWSSTLDMRLESAPGGVAKTVVQETGSTVPFTKVGSVWEAPDRFVATLVASGSDFVYTRNHFEKFTFDGTTGLLKSMSDLYGNSTDLTYSTASGHTNEAVSMTESNPATGPGRSLAIAWSGGYVDTISDPSTVGEGGPRVADVTVDGSGDMTQYQDLSGGKWTFAYTAHRMDSQTKPRHFGTTKSVRNYYDTSGRVTSQTDELDRETKIEYDTPSFGSVKVTTPTEAGQAARVSQYKFVNGVRTQTISAYGTAAEQTTNYEFDTDTNALVSVTDNAGGTTTFTSDSSGRTLSAEDPTGRISRFTYNGFDEVLTAKVGEIRTSPTATSTTDVVTTSNEYDASNGRLEKTTAAYGTSDAAVTDFVYGDSSHPEDMTSLIDARGKTSSFTYDGGTGQRLTATDPLSHTSVTTYNTIGWPTSLTSPRGVASTGTAHDFETTWAYDLAARKTTVTGPVADPAHETGDVTVTVLDANGNTASVTTGTGTGDTTVYSYDDADELVQVDPPGSGHKDYAYFASGELKRYTNELGGHWDYTYDAGGRTVTEADPLGRSTGYGYDSSGRLETVRQAVAGATCAGTKVGCVTYYHDAAGRPVGVDYSDNTAIPDVVGAGGDFTKGITYDALGRRTEEKLFTSGFVTETWSWNRRSQLTAHLDRNGRSTTFGWDKTGNMTSIRYPGTSADVVRHFDDAGRLDSVTDYAGRTVSFGYDADGDWKSSTFPGSSGTANTDEYSFDGAGRMTAAVWRQGGASGTVLGSEAYTRPDTAKGMVATTTMTGAAGTGSKANSYDTRDRLTAAGTEAFGVDDAGNLTTMADAVHQTFDDAQQLCWTSPTVTAGDCGSAKPADATVYSYDAKGNRTSSLTPGHDPVVLGYNQANQLTSAKLASSEVSDGDLVAVTPTRIVDTRDGTGTCPVAACTRLTTGQSVQTRLTGAGGGIVPSGGFSGVVVTVTVVNPAADGYLSIAPASGSSAAATLNYQAGVERSITAIVPAGTYLGLQTSQATDVVIVVSGYFRTPGAAADTYRPLTPARLVDARNGTGTCDSAPCATTTAGATTLVTAAGAGGLPGSGMHAAVATVTVINPGASGTVVVAPTTSTGGPGAARIDYLSGVTTNASFIAPVDSNGKIAVYTSTAVDLVIDVSGYFMAPDPGDLGLGLHTAPATRLVKSSTATGPCVGGSCATLAAGTRQHVQITGNAGVPAGAKAVVGSLTLNGTGTTAGYVQLNPSGTSGTGTSAEQTVEFPASSVVSAAVMVPLNDDGTIDIVSSTAGGHWTLDVFGYLSQPQGNWTYSYHADGMRATKKSPGGTVTQFDWTDGAGLPLLLSQRTQTTPGGSTWDETRIIYGPGGQPIEQINPDGTAVWLHRDQLGSVRLSTAATDGAEVATRRFNAYGTVATKTGTQPLLGYAGQYTDTETGFQYLRARYYDPSSGQFLTRDPAVGVTQLPYGYTYGDPLNHVDRNGMWPWDDTCVKGINCDDDAESLTGLCIIGVNCPEGTDSIADSSSTGRAIQVGAGVVAVAAFGVACVAATLGSCGYAIVESTPTISGWYLGAGAGGVGICEANADHMFREAEGHLAVDTMANRAILMGAVRPENLVRTTSIGVSEYQVLQADGTQIWAQVFRGEITNGGVNKVPR